MQNMKHYQSCLEKFQSSEHNIYFFLSEKEIQKIYTLKVHVRGTSRYGTTVQTFIKNSPHLNQLSIHWRKRMENTPPTEHAKHAEHIFFFGEHKTISQSTVQSSFEQSHNARLRLSTTPLSWVSFCTCYFLCAPHFTQNS